MNDIIGVFLALAPLVTGLDLLEQSQNFYWQRQDSVAILDVLLAQPTQDSVTPDCLRGNGTGLGAEGNVWGGNNTV